MNLCLGTEKHKKIRKNKEVSHPVHAGSILFRHKQDYPKPCTTVTLAILFTDKKAEE